MMVLIFLVSCLLLWLGYSLYGGHIEKKLGADFTRDTPAREKYDGIDYVPAHAPILFGHHFSSIAGAGPIVGPIIAAGIFGWAPALLWILAGAIFIGGVHDYLTLMASVRHGGRSIGEICRTYLNPLTYKLFLVFIWLALIYVIIVFTDLTAGTMAPDLSGLAGEERDRKATEYGAVATASILYLVFALIFGLSVYRFKVCYKKLSFIFIPLVFGGLWFGYYFPLKCTYFPEILGGPKNIWIALLLIYCFTASVAPVWILLQPRDYLSSFLLYACLIVGGAGLLIAGCKSEIPVRHIAFEASQMKYIFPALFITVACGAVSGFHSLVASGTTAKQLDNERSARPVAYGGMIVEAVLGVIALGTVMIVAKVPAGQAPTDTFALGLGRFSAACGLPAELGLTFGLLAVNTFLLTTLDTCTRLTRFIFEEFFQHKVTDNRYLSTILCLIVPGILCFTKVDNQPVWKTIWPAFGTTNQLLAAMTLMVASIWLLRSGKKALYALVPMLIMMLTSGTSLVLLAWTTLMKGNLLIGSMSIIMLVLALIFIGDSILVIDRARREGGQKQA